MIGESFSDTQFQTFYISREISACPHISEIIRIGKKFDDLKLYENINETIISFRYGKRLVINSDGSNFGKIDKDDILEIVDYDPIKKILLILGEKTPRIETPTHWLVCHAKKEINTIIQIKNVDLANLFKGNLPTTKKEDLLGSLEQTKDILFNLRDSNVVVLKNSGLLFVGNIAKEVESLVINTLEQIK
jgi:hypothetical protein